MELSDVIANLAAGGFTVVSQTPVQNGIQISLANGVKIIVFTKTGNVLVQGKEPFRTEVDQLIKGVGMQSTVFAPSKSSGMNKMQSSFGAVALSPSTEEGKVSASDPAAEKKKDKKIFIVHGHDAPSLMQLQLILHQSGYTPVVLAQELNAGATIIEKLERHFFDDSIGCAIVLATPDDSYDGGSKVRCRPNVDLELGYVMAKLSRRKFVYLKRNVAPNVDFILPSDVLGVVYTAFDTIDNVKHTILTELHNIFQN